MSSSIPSRPRRPSICSASSRTPTWRNRLPAPSFSFRNVRLLRPWPLSSTRPPFLVFVAALPTGLLFRLAGCQAEDFSINLEKRRPSWTRPSKTSEVEKSTSSCPQLFWKKVCLFNLCQISDHSFTRAFLKIMTREPESPFWYLSFHKL